MVFFIVLWASLRAARFVLSTKYYLGSDIVKYHTLKQEFEAKLRVSKVPVIVFLSVCFVLADDTLVVYRLTTTNCDVPFLFNPFRVVQVWFCCLWLMVPI